MENKIDTIVNSCCGSDEKNKAKAAITINLQLWNSVNKTVRDSAIKSVYKPLVNIKRRGNYVQVDLIFISALDPDLRTMFALLEKYGQSLTELTPANLEIPIATLTIVPLEYNGDYYINGINPILWVIQPEVIGSTSNNVLTMLFNADEFNFYQTDSSEIAEMAKVDAEAEIEREEAYRTQQEDMFQRKKMEEEEYQQERNKRYEEYRNNQ